LLRSPQWTDLHEILHRGSSRGRNHLFQILCRSVEGFRICAGSEFCHSPLNESVKERYPTKKFLFTAIGSSSVKTVTARTGDKLIRGILSSISLNEIERLLNAKISKISLTQAEYSLFCFKFRCHCNYGHSGGKFVDTVLTSGQSLWVDQLYDILVYLLCVLSNSSVR